MPKYAQNGKNKNMREIDLTKGYKAIIDDEDYEHVSLINWHVLGGGLSTRAPYAQGWNPETKKPCYMHRYIMGVSDPLVKVDHINANGLDNTRSNLRLCSHAENMRNKSKTYGKSQYLGVTWHKREKKWVAELRMKGKRLRLGSFDNEDAAGQAYIEAAKIHFKEFAPTNVKYIER